MMSPDISSSTTAGGPSDTKPTAPRAGGEESAAGSGGLLANSRIATRVGALALLGAIGLVGVGIAYLAGDSRIAFEIGESDEQANLAEAASEVHILALLMRDSEQRYFARRDPAYVDAYEDHAEELLYRLESLAGAYAGHADHVARAARKQQEEHAGHAETTEQEEPVEDDHSAANAGSVDALNWLAQKHIMLFRELVTLNELLGFAEGEGLRGRMRETSRAAERALVALDLDAIAAKLLRMRLHELEFIARGDEQSVRRFDGRRSEINFLLGNARVDETKKENVVDLIDQYTDTFHGFATAYQAEGEAVHAIDTIQSTITEVNEIAATIASAVEQQGSSTQEISRNIHEAAKGTQDVSSSIVSVNQAANDAGTAAGVVLATASKVGAQAESLRETVGEFLQQVRVG